MAKRNLPNGAAVPMESGERDRYVRIEYLRRAENGASGAPQDTWAALTDCWMRKMQTRQSERFRANQTTAVPDTQWEMGYREDMDPDLDGNDIAGKRRLVYQGWIYEIVGADQIGRREGIELLTSGRKPVPS